MHTDCCCIPIFHLPHFSPDPALNFSNILVCRLLLSSHLLHLLIATSFSPFSDFASPFPNCSLYPSSICRTSCQIPI
ncbi:hypothetical protein SLEP1_g28147 [Rubroshorea leprosula]|uniref:Uncharacterized protein n=1 Tax=Rubroshorea leprosula TaxID=152421 RepID=A0AAV5JSQ3_9ROSI|nr:hypothetical protein SLEP1_g28147 [Rubroshorea leprosula]